MNEIPLILEEWNWEVSVPELHSFDSIWEVSDPKAYELNHTVSFLHQKSCDKYLKKMTSDKHKLNGNVVYVVFKCAYFLEVIATQILVLKINASPLMDNRVLYTEANCHL